MSGEYYGHTEDDWNNAKEEIRQILLNFIGISLRSPPLPKLLDN